MLSNYSWVTFAIFLVCLVLTLAVGVGFLSTRSLRTKLEREFLILIGLAIVWNFISVIVQQPIDPSLRITLSRIGSPAWIFFCWRAFEFLRILTQHPKTNFSWLFFISAVLASAMNIFTHWIEISYNQGIIGYYASTGILQIPVLFLCGLLPYFLGIIFIYKRIPFAAPEERKSLRFVLWSTPGVLILGLILGGVFPAFGIDDFTNLSTAVFTIFIVSAFFVALSREDISLSLSQAAQSLFHEMKDGIILTNLDGRIEQINPAATQIIRYEATEMIGENIQKFIPEFRHDQWYLDFPMQSPDGHAHFTLTATLQKNKGISYGKLLILHDTTELVSLQSNLANWPVLHESHFAEKSLALREAHEHIRAREQQLQSLVDNLPFQVYVKDRSGRYVLQNQRDRERRGNLIGLNINETTSTPEQIAENLDNDTKVFTGAEWEAEIQTEYQGKPVILHSVKRPIMNENGVIDGLLGILTDVTDLHRIEKERMEFKERLLQSHKMEAIGTLAGGIAHDFNNILGALTGYCELAIETTSDDAPAQKYLKEVLVASERGRQLVQQILTFSRQEEKEQKPIAVGFTIRETLNLLKGNIPRNIKITQDLPLQEVFVLGDPLELHRIILNLCTNAIHSMRENGGNLIVRTFELATTVPESQWNIQLPAGHWLVIEVADSGHGIAEEKLSRIFDPFYTTKKPSEGTGLGLSVVLGILQSWKAQIAVQSSKQTGTQFRIFLPTTPRRQRNSDLRKTSATRVLQQVGSTVLDQKIHSALAQMEIEWSKLRSVDDVPRFWRVAPWKIGFLNQEELDLPYELLINQWRAQGIQSPFIVFTATPSTVDSNDLDLSQRVAAVDLDVTPEQLLSTVQRFLW